MPLQLRAILVATLLCACTSTASHGNRWAIRIVGTDGQFVGGVILELTSEPSPKSCVGIREAVLARIVEKRGFPGDIVRDKAAVHLKDGVLYADLSVGVCDHTLTLNGTVTGTRASGEVVRSTLFGAMKVGTFVAENQ